MVAPESGGQERILLLCVSCPALQYATNRPRGLSTLPVYTPTREQTAFHEAVDLHSSPFRQTNCDSASDPTRPPVLSRPVPALHLLMEQETASIGRFGLINWSDARLKVKPGHTCCYLNSPLSELYMKLLFTHYVIEYSLNPEDHLNQ